MKDGDIDYSGYSTSELKEALIGIDQAKYPENYKRLRNACSGISEQELSTFVAEKLGDRSRANQSRSKKASLSSYYYSNFVCSLAGLPMLLIVSLQEDLFGLHVLWLVPIMIVICAINLEDLKWLFQDHQSRNAWLILTVSTTLMSFVRFFENDLLFFFLISVWIVVFLSCCHVIHSRYISYRNFRPEYSLK